MDHPLTPISRDTLRGLKAETDKKRRLEEEKLHRANINRILRIIYMMTIEEARSSTNTSFQIDSDNPRLYSSFTTPHTSSEIFVKNVKEIASSLEDLFPGCSVRHFIINQPPHRIPTQKTVITVDWS